MPATLKGDLTKRMRQGERKAATAVRETAKEIVRDAKARAPVDSGHLKASIRSEQLDTHRALVTVDTADETHPSYAAYVEFGTRHMSAQPFFTLPAWQARKRFFRALSKAYEK